MIRFVDGKPVQVPDDERITPELKAIRAHMQQFLNWLSQPHPELERKFREGILSREPGFDWYDPTKTPD